MDSIQVRKFPNKMEKEVVNKKKGTDSEIFAEFLSNQNIKNQQSVAVQKQIPLGVMATDADATDTQNNWKSSEHSISQETKISDDVPNNLKNQTIVISEIRSTQIPSYLDISEVDLKDQQLTQLPNSNIETVDQNVVSTSILKKATTTYGSLSEHSSEIRENVQLLTSIVDANDSSKLVNIESAAEGRTLLIKAIPEDLTTSNKVLSRTILGQETSDVKKINEKYPMNSVYMGMPMLTIQQPKDTFGSNTVQQPQLEIKDEQKIVQVMIKNVSKSSQEGVKELTIQLNPSSIGEVKIQMKVTSEQVDLVFRLQSAQTKEMFENVTKQFIQTLDTMTQRGEQEKVTVVPQFYVKGNEELSNLAPTNLQAMQQMSFDFTNNQESQQKFTQTTPSTNQGKSFATRFEKSIEEIHAIEPEKKGTVSILV